MSKFLIFCLLLSSTQLFAQTKNKQTKLEKAIKSPLTEVLVGMTGGAASGIAALGHNKLAGFNKADAIAKSNLFLLEHERNVILTEINQSKKLLLTLKDPKIEKDFWEFYSEHKIGPEEGKLRYLNKIAEIEKKLKLDEAKLVEFDSKYLHMIQGDVNQKFKFLLNNQDALNPESKKLVVEYNKNILTRNRLGLLTLLPTALFFHGYYRDYESYQNSENEEQIDTSFIENSNRSETESINEKAKSSQKLVSKQQ